MIKFFRKIRQQLINEGNLKKYLVYAVGEILLVMIGILLALQVNNWNQSKSENNISQDYLGNLNLELASDLKHFGELKVRNEEQTTQINELLLAINKDEPSLAGNELVLKLMDAMRPNQFTPKTATYNDLVMSGKMSYVKPIDLRQKIITHFNFLAEKSLHINREIDYNWNHFHPFFNNNGYFEWRNHPMLKLDTTLVQASTRFAILELDKTSPAFKAVENNLFYRKAILLVRKQTLEELMASTKSLISAIAD